MGLYSFFKKLSLLPTLLLQCLYVLLILLCPFPLFYVYLLVISLVLLLLLASSFLVVSLILEPIPVDSVPDESCVDLMTPWWMVCLVLSLVELVFYCLCVLYVDGLKKFFVWRNCNRVPILNIVDIRRLWCWREWTVRP